MGTRMYPGDSVSGGAPLTQWTSQPPPSQPPPPPTAHSPLPVSASPSPSATSRRRTVWLLAGAVLAAVVVVLILALGGGSSSLTNASAAINLSAADLPGFHVVAPVGVVPVGRNASAQFERCLGATLTGGGGDSATVNSPTFVSGTGAQTATVVSGLAVAPSGGLVARQFAALNVPALPQCAARAVAKSLHTTAGPKGGRAPRARSRRRYPRRMELSSGHNWRFTYPVRRCGIRRICRRGRASANTFGQPPPAAFVRRLSSLLIGRASRTAH